MEHWRGEAESLSGRMQLNVPKSGYCFRAFYSDINARNAFKLFLQKQSCFPARAPPALQRNIENLEGSGAYVHYFWMSKITPTSPEVL